VSHGFETATVHLNFPGAVNEAHAPKKRQIPSHSDIRALQDYLCTEPSRAKEKQMTLSSIEM